MTELTPISEKKITGSTITAWYCSSVLCRLKFIFTGRLFIIEPKGSSAKSVVIDDPEG